MIRFFYALFFPAIRFINFCCSFFVKLFLQWSLKETVVSTPSSTIVLKSFPYRW
jgi:hypothetical protein